MPQLDERAFPQLDDDEMDCVRTIACEQCYDDGAVLFRAGDANIDLFVVLDGELRILNPSDDDREIARHGRGHFSGDIDLLTGRPAIVTGIACGRTRVLRVPSDKIRRLLNTIPRVSEKLMIAFQVRRNLLQSSGRLGLRVIGSKECRDTNLVREFLYKNFMPFTWYDVDSAEGKARYEECGSPGKTPIVDCNGKRLVCPSLRELSECAGVWRACPTSVIDLAVIGAGPAGLAAAVYGASEGLKIIVLDRLGPGGQAGGSSRIENFIGFPAGLSGADLATRGVLQMMKFGADMIAPLSAVALEPQAHGPHHLKLDCGSTLKAHHVLIATGATWRKLEANGAERFERTGIYYACTTVESRLHEGEELAVVGGGNSAGQAAMFLAEHCASHVHILIRGKALDTMSSYLSDRIAASDRITLHTQTEIDEVFGDHRVESIRLKRKTDGPDKLNVGAVFVFIGAQPRSEWLPDTLARDAGGYLLTGMEMMIQGHWTDTNRLPCPLETSIPGVLAAGDVRAGSTKRVGFAVGDGSLAITCVHSLRRQMR